MSTHTDKAWGTRSGTPPGLVGRRLAPLGGVVLVGRLSDRRQPARFSAWRIAMADGGRYIRSTYSWSIRVVENCQSDVAIACCISSIYAAGTLSGPRS